MAKKFLTPRLLLALVVMVIYATITVSGMFSIDDAEAKTQFLTRAYDGILVIVGSAIAYFFGSKPQ